jgi:TrmH family RNA methyltransferase
LASRLPDQATRKARVPPRILKVSSANTAYQRVDVLLRNRTKRHRYGEFVVEGVRAINAAIENGWTIRAFAYAQGRELSRWASAILESSTAESHLEVGPPLFQELSGKEDPSELLAVVATRPDSVDRIPVASGMVALVVDRPASPGNLGTLIRSCDAFGVSGVIVTGHGVDLYDPATIRATVGSFFSVPCVGTSARASSPLRDFDWSGGIVLVVGNETHGLSHAYRELCDDIVTIPMQGRVTSLNAAVATSIVLYEISLRRSG